MATEAAQATRQHILAAAEALILDRGLGCATTRAIAERAGCAEGSIYRHFPDKQALILEIVRRRFPAFLELMASLPERAGQGRVRENLREVGRAALEFHRGMMPLITGPMHDHQLLLEQRRRFQETGTGPMKIMRSLAAYLEAEQRAGGISADASPEHVARLVLGVCFAQAFLEALVGPEAALGTDEEFVEGTVGSLVAGLAPPRPRRR